MPKRVTVFRLSQRILQQEEQASKITKAQSFPELNKYSLCESCSFLGAEPGPACVLLFHVVKLSVSVTLTFEGATCTVSKDWQRSGYIQQWISGNFNFPKCLIFGGGWYVLWCLATTWRCRMQKRTSEMAFSDDFASIHVVRIFFLARKKIGKTEWQKNLNIFRDNPWFPSRLAWAAL